MEFIEARYTQANVTSEAFQDSFAICAPIRAHSSPESESELEPLSSDQSLGDRWSGLGTTSSAAKLSARHPLALCDSWLAPAGQGSAPDPLQDPSCKL